MRNFGRITSASNNFEVGQVVAMDGGYREDLSVELFIGPTEAAAPEPTPIVELSEVQIIYDHEKPRKRRSVKP